MRYLASLVISGVEGNIEEGEALGSVLTRRHCTGGTIHLQFSGVMVPG